ncbi:MAG: ABC transporter substrate-binding protein [Gemmatimonadales bacterium]
MTAAPARVVSLVPAATEMVVTLGAEARLVGISHECDYPPRLSRLPRVTSTPIDPTRDGATIDQAVRDALAAGTPLFAVDADRLAALRPDLVLTQAVCQVCAVAEGSVVDLAAALDPKPMVVSLGARTRDGIFEDLVAVGTALDLAADAEELVAGLRYRIDRVKAEPIEVRPRVVAIEWLEPLFLAGHWVAEMIEAAGGKDVGASPGEHSRERAWSEVAALEPEVVFVALCGFDADRSAAEWRRFVGGGSTAAEAARGLGHQVYALDGNGHVSRPGPRVVDGIEAMAAALRGRRDGSVRVLS